MEKRIIGFIGNRRIITPSYKATHLELILDNSTIKWGVCKRSFKINNTVKGLIGYLETIPIIVNNNNKLKLGMLTITKDGIVQKKTYNGLINLVTPTINQSEITEEPYVDLGLPSGKKWASCNLGATSPCEYGDFYAWGETTPKSGYSWSTYAHGTSSSNLTKYNSTDNKTVLDQEDDAVYQATNGAAHMPTKADIDELINNTNNSWCTCTVLGDDHTSHTVNGRLFVSKTDDTKKIFIPAAGNQRGSSVFDRGDYFYVWSSSLNEGSSYAAWYLYSRSGNLDSSNYNRCYGYSVRGVKD